MPECCPKSSVTDFAVKTFNCLLEQPSGMIARWLAGAPIWTQTWSLQTDQRVVKVLSAPKSLNKPCGILNSFTSVEYAKFEGRDTVTFSKLKPNTGQKQATGLLLLWVEHLVISRCMYCILTTLLFMRTPEKAVVDHWWAFLTYSSCPLLCSNVYIKCSLDIRNTQSILMS